VGAQRDPFNRIQYLPSGKMKSPPYPMAAATEHLLTFCSDLFGGGDYRHMMRSLEQIYRDTTGLAWDAYQVSLKTRTSPADVITIGACEDGMWTFEGREIPGLSTAFIECLSTFAPRS
jgi:hypothetical protein